MTTPIASKRTAAHASDASYVSIVRGLRGKAPSDPKTFNTPNGRSAAVIAASLRMGVLAEVRADEIDEARAPLDVVGELVEARARRRQQHRIAGLRQADRARDRGGERSDAFDGRARPGKRALDHRRIASDEKHRTAMRIDGSAQRREVLPLAIAARDEHHASAEARERDARRCDRRALRIIDEQYAANFGDALHPMRQALERGDR